MGFTIFGARTSHYRVFLFQRCFQFGLLFVFTLMKSFSFAATIQVNGTTCTLKAAIIAANTDTVRQDCGAGNGTDTIILAPGSVHTLSRVDNSKYGPTGLPVIVSAITIQGNGGVIERDRSSAPFRLITVAGKGDLTLDNVTLRYGAGVGYWPENAAGGVANFGGRLAIHNSIITGNSSGSGVTQVGTYGGETQSTTITNSTLTQNLVGVLSSGVDGRVTITDSILVENLGSGVFTFRDGSVALIHSTINGNAGCGLVAGELGTISLTDSVVQGNGCGASIQEDDGLLIIERSVISGNLGVGVGNSEGDVFLTDSIVSDNLGTGVGSASRTNINKSTIIRNLGQGVYQRYGRLHMRNSTISDNADGGVFIGADDDYASLATLEQCTITGNTGTFAGGVANEGTLFLSRTLVAGNVGPSIDTAEISNRLSGEIHADDFNLIGVNGSARSSGFTPGPSDLIPARGVGLRQILAPVVAANGGFSPTYALAVGSPALDAIPLSHPDCIEVDQRGLPRPQGAGCDIGAVEAGDFDQDGIADELDNCPGTGNLEQTDTDADTRGDQCDNCPRQKNVLQQDDDFDGVGNACDPDDDNDGVTDRMDNCPRFSNSHQVDTDGDGLGDICDSDDDEDGIPDSQDNCRQVASANQLDSDRDGRGDVCDLDDDNDEILDDDDNCPLLATPDQRDADHDGLGNLCDPEPTNPDADQDGIKDKQDNCPIIVNANQADSNGDGRGDACTLDLAILDVRPSESTVRLTSRTPEKTQEFTMQIQNQSPQKLLIPNAESFASLAKLTTFSLGAGTCPSLPSTLLMDKVRFPLILASEQQFTLRFQITVNSTCIPDPQRQVGHGETHADYRIYASVASDLLTLAGNTLQDADLTDNTCPRFGNRHDPNPDNNITDQGCGSILPGGGRSSILLDVVADQ